MVEGSSETPAGGLTVVLELLLGGAVAVGSGEEPPGREAHVQLGPLSHLG